MVGFSGQIVRILRVFFLKIDRNGEEKFFYGFFFKCFFFLKRALSHFFSSSLLMWFSPNSYFFLLIGFGLFLFISKILQKNERHLGGFQIRDDFDFFFQR